MNLVSCDNCAVVLDISKIPTTELRDSDGNLVVEKARWNGEDYQLIIDCPVCKHDIMIP